MQFLKKLTLILLSILGIFIIVIAILLFAVDPNRYKSRIEAFAENRANIALLINGDLSWTIFPWLGISIQDTQIATLDDHQNPIASVDELSLSLKLIPFLKGDIEIDQLQVDGLDLNIVTHADGTKNIDSFLRDNAEEPAQISDNNASTQRRELNIRTIHFANSQFKIENQQTQQTIAGNHIDFVVHNVHRKSPSFSMDSINFKSGNLQLTNHLEQTELSYQDILFNLKGFTIRHDNDLLSPTFTLQLGNFDLKNGEINYHEILTGKKIQLQPNSFQATALSYSSAENQQSGSWNIGEIAVKNLAYLSQSDDQSSPLLLDSINFRIADLNPQSQGSVIFEITSEKEESLKLHIAGHSNVTVDQPFNIWHFKESEVTANIDQLPNISLEEPMELAIFGDMSLNLEKDTITINPLSIQLDENKITGNIMLTSLQKQQGEINLKGDTIDLQKYIASTQSKTQNAGNHQSKMAAQNSNAHKMNERSLNINAELKTLNLEGISARNLQLNTQIQNNLITISKGTAQVLGGSIVLTGTINTKNSEPAINSHITVSALPLTNLFNFLEKKMPITGNLNLNGQFNTQGFHRATIMSHLQGNFQANISNGELLGTNYEQLVCEGFAALSKESFRKQNLPQTTPFKKLSGNATIKNGVLSNNNLQIEIPGLAASGSGIINLNNESLDYKINLLLKESTGISNCKIDRYLKNVSIPLHCQGSYVNVNSSLCGLDQNAIGNIIANLAKNKIESTIKENIQDILPPAFQQNRKEEHKNPKPKDVIRAFEGIFNR